MPSLSPVTRRWAAVLRFAALAGVALVALSWLWAARDPATFAAARATELALDISGWTTGALARAGLLALSLLSALAALFTLWQAARLFAAYAQDAALAPQAAEAIRGVGTGLLALALLGILRRTGDTLLLTLGAPEGQRMLAVGLGSDDLGFLLAAALMLLIGVVMGQAVEIARENEAFV